MRTATVFEIRYRARGYDDADAALLREELEAFGAVRLRPLQLPEAGGTFELWGVIQFVGTMMLGGILEHIATRYYDKLSAALIRFYRAKTAKEGVEPEMSLTVSYDDVDLDIGPVTEKDLRSLPRLADSIHEHINRSPLRDKPVTRIVVGMLEAGDQWHEPHLQEWPENGRFWGLSFEGHRSVTHVYDTETKLLSELPHNEAGSHQAAIPGSA